jgi:hypothetical protein
MGWTLPPPPIRLRSGLIPLARHATEAPIHLYDAVLAGAGAVGNGFLRGARHLNVTGDLTIVDPKVAGAGNPNRCLYFREGDNGPKAEVLAARAQGDFPALHLTPVVGTFHDIVEANGRVKRVIIGTDSRGARRSIQNDLPLEVLDASTTGATRRSFAPPAERASVPWLHLSPHTGRIGTRTAHCRRDRR